MIVVKPAHWYAVAKLMTRVDPRFSNYRGRHRLFTPGRAFVNSDRPRTFSSFSGAGPGAGAGILLMLLPRKLALGKAHWPQASKCTETSFCAGGAVRNKLRQTKAVYASTQRTGRSLPLIRRKESSYLRRPDLTD